MTKLVIKLSQGSGGISLRL